MGYMSTSNVICSVYPPPWGEILGTTPISNGNKGFVMQPLLYQINYGQVIHIPPIVILIWIIRKMQDLWVYGEQEIKHFIQVNV